MNRKRNPQGVLEGTSHENGMPGAFARHTSNLLAGLGVLPLAPVVLIVAAVLSLTVSGFATPINLENMARVLAPLLVVATGATFVILTGGIDLSVGATFGLASIVGATVMRDTGSITLGVAAGIAVGMVIGAVNGLAVARLRLTPFVYTLAMLLTVRAIAFLMSSGYSVGRLPPEATAFGRSALIGIPTLLWIAVFIFASALLILHRTVFGRTIYLVGANERAAIFNAINVKRTIWLVYFLSGTLAGVAGMLAVLRLGSGAPVLGDNVLLLVIAAIVVGGTSIFGGEGGLWRTLTGVVLVVMLEKGLDLMGVAFYDQAIIIGVVILAGAALGVRLRRLKGLE